MLGKLPAEYKNIPFLVILKSKLLLPLVRATETTRQHLHTRILSKTTLCTGRLKLPNPGQCQLMQGREQREGNGRTREALLCLGKGLWRQWEHVSYIVTEFKQDLNLTPLSITFSLGWTKHEKLYKSIFLYIRKRNYSGSFHNWNNTRQNEGNSMIWRACLKAKWQILHHFQPSPIPYFRSTTTLTGSPSLELKWSLGERTAIGAQERVPCWVRGGSLWHGSAGWGPGWQAVWSPATTVREETHRSAPATT